MMCNRDLKMMKLREHWRTMGWIRFKTILFLDRLAGFIIRLSTNLGKMPS